MTRRYELRYTPKFDKCFRQLGEDIRLRVAPEILRLETDSILGKSLHGELKGFRSLRIGDYRVIYEISSNQVVLHRVEHRRRAYKQ